MSTAGASSAASGPQAAASATATDSNGCVVCPTTMPATITCGPGEELNLRSITCAQCPEYYCTPSDSSQRSSTPVGAIVGGTVGGAVAIFIVALLYYLLVWRKKHPEDEEMIVLSDLEDGEDKYSISSDSAQNGTASAKNSPGANGQTTFEKAVQRRGVTGRPANRRLSSYEAFTRPHARYQRRAVRRQARQTAQAQNTGPYLDPQSANRNSVATTISTTNAANILPIAYIPGVTVRPTKNNTRSIYSYDSESVFSDLNTIENASIVGDIMRANYSDKDTMTAIKAQPKLVNVDRIEEEDEDEDDTDDEAKDLIKMSSSTTTTTKHLNNSTVSNITHEDSDSDVDSDIGEIQRATSVRKNDVPQVLPVDLTGPDTRPDDASINGSGRGAFVLDVEFDDHGANSEGNRSPFEDP